MSLLDTGPDEITVYPGGGALPDAERGEVGEPVTVRCRVQPITSTEHAEAGWLDQTHYRVIARRLPAGPWARVEWAGRTWEVVGEPARRNGSPRTRHDTATIRRR